MTQQDLYSLFLSFGPIAGITLPYDTKSLSNHYSNTNKNNDSNSDTRKDTPAESPKNVGHADIQFEFEDDALAAIDNMDGFDYFDRPLRVRKAIKTGKDSTTAHNTNPVHGTSSSDSATNVFGDDGEFLGDRKKAVWDQQ